MITQRHILLIIYLIFFSIGFGQSRSKQFELKTDSFDLKTFNYRNSYLKPTFEYSGCFFEQKLTPGIQHCRLIAKPMPFASVIPIKHYLGFPLKICPKDLIYINPSKKIEGWFNYEVDESFFQGQPFPSAMRYYLDTNNICSTYDHQYLHFDKLVINDFSEFYYPFYFSKHEVTNKEYREFTNYIFDSLQHKILGGEYIFIKGNDTIINWIKKVDLTDTVISNSLAALYYPEDFRFYRAKIMNSALLKYEINGSSIPIYPDTLSWVHDFSYSFNEPMTQMYFWHPVYDNYPVVGITYWQAKAFCDWKTKQLQSEWSKINPDIIVEVDLPSMMEREFAIQNAPNYDELNDCSYYLFDNSYVTDLRLKSNDNKLLRRSNDWESLSLRKELLKNSFTEGNYVIDGGLHTLPMFNGKQKKNSHPSLINERINSNGVEYLGSNISEWTNHDYSQWKSIFVKRQKNLLAAKTEEDSIVSKIESYYDRFNDVSGKLVIGGNWLDERHSLQLGQNLDGSYAKRFVHPDSAHCTIGFRYVVRVKLKNDTSPIINSIEWQRPINHTNSLVENCEEWVVDSSNVDTIILKKTFGRNSNSFCRYITSWVCDRTTIEINQSEFINDYQLQYPPNPPKHGILEGLYLAPGRRKEYYFHQISPTKIVLTKIN